MANSKTYNEASIKWYKGLEGVRKKPGMYIGSVEDPDGGLFQITKELIDNSCDEALDGNNTLVGVILNSKEVWVYDSGRGIPVGPHKENPKRSTLEIVFTELHAGGKMDLASSGYAVSRGTHGIGAAACNALSSEFEVWTYRNGWYNQKYKQGKPVTGVVKSKGPILTGDKPLVKGTAIRFIPDPTIFKVTKLNANKIISLLQISSYFIAGCTFKFWDQTVKGSKPLVFKQKEGMKALCAEMITNCKAETIGPMFLHQDEFIDVFLQWSTYEEENVISYCNASLTASGGNHTLALQRSVMDTISKHAGVRQQKSFRSEDVRNGLQAVINVKIGAPAFDSQTKERLTSPVTDDIIKILAPKLDDFFKKNLKFTKEILSRAVDIRKAQQEFTMNKKAAAELRTTGRGRISLPVKLAIAKTKDPEKRELFLVEGDSAAGSAKIARDKEYQEVLPLKGKILNAYRDNEAKVIANESVLTILQSIGYDPSLKNPLEKLRVRGKIILLSDPDPDGYHINSLVLATLSRIIPQVFDMGIVYVVDAPLYMGRHGKIRVFGKNLADVIGKLPKNASKEGITRIKGYGEVNADVLKEIAFDKKSRRLTQILPIKASAMKRYIELVGENSEARRELMGFTPKEK